MHIDELLKIAADKKASDVHLKSGTHPMMRLHGQLIPIDDDTRLTREDLAEMTSAMMPAKLVEVFEREQEVDFAYSIPGLGRFRCNVFHQRGTIGIVLRIIPMKIFSIEELELPKVLTKIAEEERGLVLVLVTGTTGSGKSTTLAALVDHINNVRSAHVMTVEDPIEYLHRDRKAIVNQREVAVDTQSFAHALRSALRQDPDVILVGEMRDLETVETGLLAAETGHLVFSTLHTLDATETINRIISVFPPHQQRQVRIQLASVLKAVVSQRLIPRADGSGRIAALEIMVATPFIRDCIVDKERTNQIHGAIAQGTSQYGMQTFDQAIYFLHKANRITLEEALRWVSNVDEFTLKIKGIGTTSDMTRDDMAQTIDNVAPSSGPESTPPPSPDVTRFGG